MDRADPESDCHTVVGWAFTKSEALSPLYVQLLQYALVELQNAANTVVASL